ncbi:MAG: hypothetical protein LUD48_00665 [Prevotella sp.]|nr:hypothetical protein [Prevotella sp.]
MKTKIIYLFLLLFLISCSNDDVKSSDNTTETGASKLIIGEWVYDNPSSGIWEKQKFMSNMKLTYSCMELNPYFRVDNADGNYYYTTGDKKFTFTYASVTGGTIYEDVVIESIEEYAYTALYYSDDGAYEGEYIYNKLVGEYKINIGESVTPNYAELIPDASISSYSSNDTGIAKVNSSTGEIGALKAGVTYIKIVTDLGTAVVEVTVTDSDNLIPDYSSALNMNETTVKNTWTNYCTFNPVLTDRVCYPIRGNDYAYMVDIWLDDNKNVELVQVEVNTTVITDEAQREKDIHEFLSSKYIYKNTSSDGTYEYMDISQPDVTMTVLYSPSQNKIQYEIMSDLWSDYTQDLGKTASELKASYGEPFYNEGGKLYFMQDNDYIDFVVFTMNSSGEAYAVSAFMESNINMAEAFNFLDTKYFYYESGSNPSEYSYAFINAATLEESNVGITYDAIKGYITYVDLQARTTDLWPDYTQDLGKSASELKATYGEPFMEYGNYIYFLQDNDYIDFVAFTLNTSGETYAASAFLKTSCDWNEAKDYLGTKYYYYESGSDPSTNYYAYTNAATLAESNVGITFDGINGCITYVDLQASRGVKSRSTKGGIPRIEVKRP